MGNRGEHSFHALKVKLGWSILWSRSNACQQAGWWKQTWQSSLHVTSMRSCLPAIRPQPTQYLPAFNIQQQRLAEVRPTHASSASVQPEVIGDSRI